MSQQEFRTGPDGTKYPLTPKKPKNGWVGVALVAGLLVGGGAVGTGSSAAASGARAGQSAQSAQSARSGRSARSAAGEARAVVRAARVVDRLRRQGHQARLEAHRDDPDCAAHADGELRACLANHRPHRCRGLRRALIVVPVEGTEVLVAVSWVRMRDRRSAAEVRRLLVRPGAGNVVELSREIGRYRGVRFDAAASVSAVDGDTVISVRARPVSGAADARLAGAIARATLG